MLDTEKIYIIGHKNPDADAICSAIAYAAFKEATGQKNFVAARCGNSNARIDAILRRFDVPLPEFLGDVTPRVQDIMKRNVFKTLIDATCAEALETIDRYDIRALPVVDSDNVVQGQVSIFQLGEFFIPKPKKPREMRHVHTSISHIVEALGATVLNVVNPEETEHLYVRIGAMDIRSFGKFQTVEQVNPDQSIIVVGDRYDIQQKAIQMGARLLVVSGDLDIEEEVISLAKERGVSLIVSPADSATTSWIIRTATKIEPMVQTDVVTFRPDEKLHAVKRKVGTSDSPIFLVVDENEKLVGLFSKTDLLKPPNTKLILVDHNELGQAVNGAGEVSILEIVDHHRLGNPATALPINFRNQVIGSTCSIVAQMYQERDMKPDPSIAGILMAGLISDTLNLQSPTTTPADHEILPWLSEAAGAEIEEVADLIFNAGSVVLNSEPAKVITSDCKQYEQGSVKYSVSQVEELGYDNFMKRYDELNQALEDYRDENNLAFSALMVTDINTQNSLLLFCGDEEVFRAISYARLDNRNVFDLPSIVSRKKQLIPYLTNLLDSLGVGAVA